MIVNIINCQNLTGDKLGGDFQSEAPRKNETEAGSLKRREKRTPGLATVTSNQECKAQDSPRRRLQDWVLQQRRTSGERLDHTPA